MNSTRRNREIGSIKLIVISSLALILCLVIFGIVHWSDENVMKRKHETLITGIEERSKKRIMRLMSENYSDRWGFTKDQASLAWKEAGTQFLFLVVNSDDAQFEHEGKRAVVTVNLKLSGKGIGFGEEILRRANRLKTPWIFTWEKESFGPGSWRLIRMENESIPADAYGYTPGDLGRVLNGN